VLPPSVLAGGPAGASPGTSRREGGQVRGVSDVATRGRPGTLAITSPLAGALYLIDPTLRPEFQRLPFRASGGAPGALEWVVDDRSIGRAHRDEPMWWPLAKGTHTIIVRDAGGRSASTHIVVR